MRSNIKLLITDLDNTLYDWVTFFAQSFYSMLEELSIQLKVDQQILIQEFKEIHQSYENTEQPFAITELPTVQKLYKGLTNEQIVTELDDSLHAFNRKRKETLHLYEGVLPTLETLHSRGVIIIGHTEATVHNALFRINKLDVKKYMKHLYTLEGNHKPHPIPDKNQPLPNDGFVQLLAKEHRKPNPALIRDICANEGVLPQETAYVGDSLTRDISMAKEAGVFAIWARYGKLFKPEDWDKIVSITHWSDEDVDRELALRKMYSSIKPDISIDAFPELLNVIS